LKNKQVNNEENACKAYHDVDQVVRHTIKKIGSTMPEKSIKELERE